METVLFQTSGCGHRRATTCLRQTDKEGTQAMSFGKIDHLAFITPDLDGTIRFYRDLLGMELTLGIGHDGFRHY